MIIPVIIITASVVFELFYRLLGRKQWSWRLVSWGLRPWAAWAVFSVVYQLNSSRGMESVETAPTFISNIFPFFAQPWDRYESWTQAVARLVVTPTVWIWGSVVVLLGGILFLIIRCVMSDNQISIRKTVVMLTGLYLIAGALSFSVASLPNGVWDKEDHKGSLLSCWHAHNTVLYAVPFVKTRGDFLRNFKEIQPRLRITIHALSHPPGGALSMYYIGKVVGAGGMNIRLDSTRIRYALGLIFFSALNIFVLFGMGKSMFGSSRHGFTAGILWIVTPAVLAYSNFAQDGLYSVFFNLSLLLIWKVSVSDKMPYLSMVLLGLVFFCLNFLSYTWCLVTMAFVLFLVYCAFINKLSFRSLLLRGVIPLGIMTVLSGLVILRYKLDYLAAYKFSSDYVQQWYQYDTIYQHVISMVGGQFDLWLMMGAVACSAFFVSVYKRIKEREITPQFMFLIIVIFVYALPLLFGPSGIRLEAARCWMWMLSVPICFAAQFLLAQERPRVFVTVAVMVSLGTYTVMRLFLTFSP